MSLPLLMETALIRKTGLRPPAVGLVPAISELNFLAVQSLISLFDEQQRLFCRRAELTAQGLRRRGTSPRRSIIALLGLQRLAESGATFPLDVRAVQDATFEDISWVRSAGDLGLLTWLAAKHAPERLPRLFSHFDFDETLDVYTDARNKETRGLAWFLAGIAHARRVTPRELFDLTDVAVRAYQLLVDNQSEHGLFAHTGCPRSILDVGYSRFGTFADQMHAIYALTAFAREFDVAEPLEDALACANSVSALQGDRGQWWFLYDTRRGCVANRYPVHCAHQDGIGPAALLLLEEATSRPFRQAVRNGLSWIAGNNELGQDLRSFNRGLIWNSIESQWSICRHWETACSYLHVSSVPLVKKLRIRHDAYPDHFGWLLYAFGNFGLLNGAMFSTTETSESYAQRGHDGH